MKKNFLDEVMEELSKVVQDRDHGILDPETSRGKSIEAIIRVAKNHKLTAEEKKAIAAFAMSLDGITAEEADLLNRMNENEEG